MIPYFTMSRYIKMIKRGFIVLITIFFTLFLSAIFFKGSFGLFRDSSLQESVSFSDKILLKISQKELKVDIADTEEKRNKGLGGRKKLEENNGMLFIFEIPAKYSFWMKDMRFPLDIIWIDENKKIIAISEDISPDTYPASFAPSDAVKYVLEVNAGWVERNGIKIGEFIEL